MLIAAADLKWNPLEDGAMTEVLPERWNGPHVAVRLAQAFETLRATPAPLGPRAYGGIWPAYLSDWVDLLNRVGMAPTDEAPRQRDRPTVEQITRMEQAVGWGPRYLRPPLIEAVQGMALARASGRDVEWLAKVLDTSAEMLQTRNWAGSEKIAAGLCRDRVAVF
jgi:hypothetical protein